MKTTLADALAERGYETLTEVQTAVTAPELQDKDLLVSAQTGSGKTVGFGLAIAPTLLGDEDRFSRAESPLALVVAPTRELALQVMRELVWLYAKAGARVTSCVGGMDMRDERRALDRGAHIVVGTPGRLRDHIQRGSLDMSGLRAIVLDEADEMLDLGFREDLEFMLAEAPESRRTLLFSATVPQTIAHLATQYQRDAVRVKAIGEAGQHADISYQAMRVAESDAENAVTNVLRFHEAQNAIIFANTRAVVARLTARLSNRGFSVVSLSGELSQSERTHALQAMRDGRARVCVATDVAARGIDLPNLELVVHFDLPSNSETLLHRSGRTGRAGRKGTSVLIVPRKVEKKAQRLLKFAKLQAEWVAAPSAEAILQKDEDRLLNDPVWTEEATEAQTSFARRLVELHSPEAIATAYIRMYHARNSAPEDLADVDARPERKERAPFGPSKWIALSVGRKDRAEPRWILPLICRTGNLDKSNIGAIRVQDTETFVELTESSVSGFFAALENGGTLEDGITARELDKAPDAAALSQGPRSDKRPFDKSGPGRKPYGDRDRGPRKEYGAKKSYGKKPYGSDDGDAPRKPYNKGGKSDFKKAPYEKAAGRDSDRPAKPRPAAAGGKPSSWEKPSGDRGDAKPAAKYRSGAGDPSKSFKERGGKPSKGKPEGRKPRHSGGNATPKRK